MNKVYDNAGITLYHGDALATLRELPDCSVHTCVTSPPYWGLRDYGVDGQLGLERTPEEYTEKIVKIFREVRRVLMDDGTLWLNLGDCYATGAGKVGECPGGGEHEDRWKGIIGSRGGSAKQSQNHHAMGPATQPNRIPLHGLKPKDLVGIPWRVAFALQSDGWWLRQDIIWHKPQAMPESVRDRCTKAHEYIFLLSSAEHYYYDHEAIMEPCASGPSDVRKMLEHQERIGGKYKYETKSDHNGFHDRYPKKAALYRNRRSVWSVATASCSEAHFATFPPRLIEPCILAGSPAGGVVLDPFLGIGTTALTAHRLGRACVGIELNSEYVAMAQRRIEQATAQGDLFRRRNRKHNDQLTEANHEVPPQTYD